MLEEGGGNSKFDCDGGAVHEGLKDCHSGEMKQQSKGSNGRKFLPLR